MNEEDAAKIADYWDRNVQVRERPPPENVIHWLNSPLVGEHCLQKLSVHGKSLSVLEWLPWFKDKYVPHALESGLSLGCGDGALERHALALGICLHLDAHDVSPRSVEIAKAEAQRQGLSGRVTYHASNIDYISLAEDKYDVVFVGSAMHHFSRLEHVIAEIRRSLKTPGLIVINEFVGPSQFQWTDKQLQIINELLAILPHRLRYDVTTNTEKAPVARPTIESMNAIDPSEAIRSAEIMSALSKEFDIVERVDYGGTLLHPLLYAIVDNFRADSAEDRAILKLLGYIEDVLIREGVLDSDFSIVVLRQ
jgi:SAM-dependent methyltransferase